MRYNLLAALIVAGLCSNVTLAASIRTECFSLKLGGDWKESPGGIGKDKMIYLPRNAIYAKISCSDTRISPAEYSAFKEFAVTRNVEVATEDLSREDASIELADKMSEASDAQVEFRYLWRGKEKAIYQSNGAVRNGKMLVVTVRSIGLNDKKHSELMNSVLKGIQW